MDATFPSAAPPGLSGTMRGLADALPSLAALPASEQLQRLVQQGLDRLPAPGTGKTLDRWRVLSHVAHHDLSLAKLYEGHTDALAILEELGAPPPPASSSWGVWAAEAPGKRLCIEPHEASGPQRSTVVSGHKAWCSGARSLSHALITAWLPGQDHSQLVAVALDHPSIQISEDSWHAVGMAGTRTAEVRFNATPATLVGPPGGYLRRPGFWHGGAGIAACWYGGTLAVADALFQAVRVSNADHPQYTLRAAALGQVDRVLAGLVALLQRSAALIDAHPTADAMMIALRARQAAEAAATCVMDETGRALGASAYCLDARFARAAADLQVFIRQSHGSRDDAALAGVVLASEDYPWTL